MSPAMSTATHGCTGGVMRNPDYVLAIIYWIAAIVLLLDLFYWRPL